jgi:DNA repair protein RadC
VTIYEKRPDVNLPTITSSKDVYQFMKQNLYYNFTNLTTKEVFCCIYLARNSRIKAVEEISKGSDSGTIVDVKDIMATAVNYKAHGLILTHNHPSGNLQPSTKDKKLTERISNAAKLFDMKLLDHLIITDTGYLSFADEGIPF